MKKLTVRKIKRIFRNIVHKPVKGSMAYEFDFLCFIFMLKYPHSDFEPERKNYKFYVKITRYWF